MVYSVSMRVILAVLFVCVVVAGSGRSGELLEGMHTSFERVVLSLFPSSERAYQYGARHFSSHNAAAYDPDTALAFFLTSAALDARHPFAVHEIARLYFLKGDFAQALSYSNIQVRYHGAAYPNAYYVRGLIKGFMGDYDGARRDYEEYLRSDVTNWAALNDYAWVLLKAGRANAAAIATARGLTHFPQNPWLLNSRAIALAELGQLREARDAARDAVRASMQLTEEEWLIAYPGNDPRVAAQGILTLQESTRRNLGAVNGR